MAQSLPDVIPVLPYRDIRAGHDFLVGVFGFESGGIELDGDGKVVHAEVRTGGRRIWLHEAQTKLAPPQQAGLSTAGLVVQVADVDAHFARAKAAGADILREPTDEEYGQREYGVADPEGHTWYFATPFGPPAQA